MLIQKNSLQEIGSKVVITLSTGLEIVAKLESSWETYIEVSGAHRLIQVQGGVGLAPASMLSDQKAPTRIYNNHIVSMGVLDPEFDKQYDQAVTSIALV